jgi:hypothetical protein
MTGKTLATILGVLVLVVLVGFLIFGRGGDNVARDGNTLEEVNATSTENIEGIGGPENEGFDPLNPNSTNNSDNPNSNDSNYIIEDKG